MNSRSRLSGKCVCVASDRGRPRKRITQSPFRVTFWPVERSSAGPHPGTYRVAGNGMGIERQGGVHVLVFHDRNDVHELHTLVQEMTRADNTRPRATGLRGCCLAILILQRLQRRPLRRVPRHALPRGARRGRRRVLHARYANPNMAYSAHGGAAQARNSGRKP